MEKLHLRIVIGGIVAILLFISTISIRNIVTFQMDGFHIFSATVCVAVIVGLARKTVWARLIAELLLFLTALLLPISFAGYGLEPPEPGYSHPLETLLGLSPNAAIQVGISIGVMFSGIPIWGIGVLKKSKNQFRSVFW